MDDKAIRKILISSLKVVYPEMRLYQEKMIGSSICDLMAVTDRLIGYEIKSDQDNYARIDSQVNWYDQFFDLNYIVVGKTHEKSAKSMIPNHWGIVVITEDNVSVSRCPLPNQNVNRKRQLSILWKLELKNLLNYFRLPMFALKSKEFITNKLVERVPDDQLREQIAYELMHRDYSVYNAKDYTEHYKRDEVGNSDLSEYQMLELVDNVSEMELEKMTLDQWIEIYRRAKKINETKTKAQKTMLPREKHAITYEDIEASLGVPWISADIITDFAYYIKYEGSNNTGYRTPVNYEPITGNWFVERKNDCNHIPNCYMKYGLKQYNAMYILEATLNLREIKLYDSEHKYDEKSTLAAIEKQKLIQELFQTWVWEDEDRKWEIEEAYNKLFGKYKRVRFDGSSLEFPEMSEGHDLFDYQRDAVQRIISTNNTLLAFDVGAGKTFIMIAASMLMRQQGLSRKNMFVVPNNIVGQWEKMFTELYPSARLLVIEPKNFKRPIRDKAMQQMKYGDYDGIIIAYSCFEMIPISTEYISTQMRDKITEIDQAISKIGFEAGSFTALKNAKKNIIKLSQELIKCMDYTATSVSFDELEINTLFLDEAHNYKNLPIRTKMKNVRGINTKGSAKCFDMLQKVRFVQNTNNGRGVVFATGTPLSNSLSDAYAMQIYLQYEDMVSGELETFDNWIKTFARPERVAEIDMDTQHYRFVTRFAKFFNLPELSRMFSQIAVFHAMNEDDGIPEFKGYSDCVISRNTELNNYMLTLAERTENIRSGNVKGNFDNMLKVSTDGRKAALDLRLVDEEQPEVSSKLHECVRNVKAVYETYEGCSQLIFCDYSTPKSKEFNVYTCVKDALTTMGVPDKEVAFIHSYHTEERKVALYNKVNEGAVRVLIGSTFKLGIGANVQTKLKAVHHLDVPWRPADMVQREGRILRKGNLNKEVFIYRYICEGSFDAYSWQILESKQRFISQFLCGSAYQRTATDLEENVLNYAEVKALALSDPRMKELAEKENELLNLRIICSNYAESRSKLDDDIKKTENSLHLIEVQIKGSEENLKTIKDLKRSEYKTARKILTEMLLPDSMAESAKMIGSIWGFDISSPQVQIDKKPVFWISKNGASYAIECGETAAGNAKIVTNFLQKLPDYIADLKQKYEDKKVVLEQLQEGRLKKNPYLDDLKRLENEVKRLRIEIGIAE